MIEGVRDVRAQLRVADAAIARVRDEARRTQLRTEAEQVRVPLTQAIEAGHRFVYDQLQERLSQARTRLGSLQDEIANPTPAR